MDGEVLSTSKHKRCAGSGAFATPTLLGVQKASRLWRRLIFGGASDAPAKILAAMLAARSVTRDAACVE
jgi:hypothetical protein